MAARNLLRFSTGGVVEKSCADQEMLNAAIQGSSDRPNQILKAAFRRFESRDI